MQISELVNSVSSSRVENSKKANMKTEFLNFYRQLEKDQRFEVIEFRLRFQKTMNKYRISKCCSIEEELIKMKKNYLENLKC